MIIDIAERGLSDYLDEEALKKIIGDIYSRAIKLYSDVSDDVDQYDEIIKSVDFQPF
jgi:site-specific DNA-adenine methylase